MAAPVESTPVAPRELRSFAFTVGGAFVVLALLAWWRGRHLPPLLFGAVGAALVAAGALAPARLAPVHRAWMALALALSRVTTPLFMGVVYFLVLTPIGLALRLVGRRPLRPPPKGASAWVDRPAGERRGDLRRQF